MRYTGVCLELINLSRNVAKFLAKMITKKMEFEYFTFVVLSFIFISPLMNKGTMPSIKEQNETVVTCAFFHISEGLKYWVIPKNNVS